MAVPFPMCRCTDSPYAIFSDWYESYNQEGETNSESRRDLAGALSSGASGGVKSGQNPLSLSHKVPSPSSEHPRAAGSASSITPPPRLKQTFVFVPRPWNTRYEVARHQRMIFLTLRHRRTRTGHTRTGCLRFRRSPCYSPAQDTVTLENRVEAQPSAAGRRHRRTSTADPSCGQVSRPRPKSRTSSSVAAPDSAGCRRSGARGDGTG